MNEFNNNNFDRNNENNFNAGMNSGFDNSGMNNMNEVSYQPQKKKSAGKKIVTGIVALLSVLAIGTTSIVGYTLVTGRKLVPTSDNTTSSVSKSSSEAESSKIDRSNIPTLEQLSTPSDALSIPDIVKKVSPSVVGISCMLDNGSCTGTGIIMSEDGYVITNAHVVDSAKSISVLLPENYLDKDSSSSEASKDSKAESTDSKKDDSESSQENLTYTATLIGKDNQSDIAVLKIDKKGLTPVEFGKSSEIQVGEASVVIGNPLGFTLANSVTAGIISATDRSLTVEDRTMNLIQTDASINSGNSGGPLINAYGQVIGITSEKVSSTYGEGLGFAIPIDEALPIIEDLMKNGYVTGRPSLGLTGTDISSAYSQYYGIPQGFLVKSVTEGSGAEKAGIQENDIVIGINDTVISSISELNEIKNKYKVGDSVKLTIYRNGKMIDVNVELGESTGEAEPDDNNSNNNNNNNNGNNYGYGYGNGDDYGNGFGNYGYGFGF